MIFSVSDFTRRELLNRYPHLGTKTHVLPNALDPHFAMPHVSNMEHDRFTILAVSRLAAHDQGKGIDDLITAMSRINLSIPDARLVIVGEDVDMPRLEALAQSSTAQNSIEFKGGLSDDELAEEFTGCSLFALPSCKEGFGLVDLEAMAAGNPVSSPPKEERLNSLPTIQD